MFKLNNTEITKDKAIEYIDDLAMFPQNEEDMHLNVANRKEKYLDMLEKRVPISITNTLILVKE